MIILKVKDKGTVVDIPGTKKVRTPADIDITKVDINFVSMYLRKQGIKHYEIVSDTGEKEILPNIKTTVKKKKDDGKWKDNIEARFNKLESFGNVLHGLSVALKVLNIGALPDGLLGCPAGPRSNSSQL